MNQIVVDLTLSGVITMRLSVEGAANQYVCSWQVYPADPDRLEFSALKAQVYANYARVVSRIVRFAARHRAEVQVTAPAQSGWVSLGRQFEDSASPKGDGLYQFLLDDLRFKLKRSGLIGND